jgi:hypothetical protein
MGRIYQQCSRALIWLGCDASECNLHCSRDGDKRRERNDPFELFRLFDRHISEWPVSQRPKTRIRSSLNTTQRSLEGERESQRLPLVDTHLDRARGTAASTSFVRIRHLEHAPPRSPRPRQELLHPQQRMLREHPFPIPRKYNGRSGHTMRALRPTPLRLQSSISRHSAQSRYLPQTLWPSTMSRSAGQNLRHARPDRQSLWRDCTRLLGAPAIRLLPCCLRIIGRTIRGPAESERLPVWPIVRQMGLLGYEL